MNPTPSPTAAHRLQLPTAGGCSSRVAPLFALFVVLSMPLPALGQSLDMVLRWNRVMLDAVVVPGANPPTVFVHRPMAVVSAAMFDAANSFDRIFAPHVAYVEAPDGASRDAAVAQAAHDALVAVLPSLRATFDAALEGSLAGLPAEAARDGARVGAAAAKAILERRAQDGWSRAPSDYLLPQLPGYWQPTPPANAAATFTHYPDVAGFVTPNGRRFSAEAPPELTSARYATDFNETKAIGALNSATRTADQTMMARLWHGVGTTTTSPTVWNLVLADAARARGWTGLEAARGFALMNMTQHDALLTAFTWKFHYGLWRPVTAIREADRDGNAATGADPGWTPLLNTPPYPGHPGNRACLSASQATLLEHLFERDDMAVRVTWNVPTGQPVTREYPGFRHLANEEADSRIWGGIHFRFESLVSQGTCSELANYIADNHLRRH
jgi:hypothetical protein